MTERALTTWVIYDNPKDHPGQFVVRRQYAVRGGVEFDPEALLFDTLEAARRAVPPGLHNLGRYDEDDPKIVEAWI